MDEKTITVQDLTWSQLKDAVRVWKIDTSRDPLTLELKGRQGIDVSLTKNEVVNYFNSNSQLGFKNYVADLDPVTTQYWTAADQFVDAQIAQSAEEFQSSQPNQAQLNEMVEGWATATAEEKSLAEEFHAKHPEVTVYQALQRIRAGEGTVAGKSVKAGEEPTRVAPAAIRGRREAAGPAPKRDLELERRMELLYQRAAASPESRSLRHDIRGWTAQHFLNPFRDSWRRLFGEGRIAQPVEEAVSVAGAVGEIAAPRGPAGGLAGEIGPAGPSLSPAGPAPSLGQKNFGGFRNAAANTRQKVSKAVDQAKELASLAINAGRALAGDPKAILNLAKTALESKTVRKIAQFLAGAGVEIAIFLAALLAKLGIGLAAVVGMAAGAVAAIVFGLPLLPAAIIGGVAFGVGAWLWQSGLGSALAELGSTAVSVLTSIGTTVSGLLSSLTSGLAASAVPTIAVGGTLIVIPTFALILQMQNNEAFRAVASSGKLFSVVKTVDKSQLPPNPKDDVVYTVIISTDQDNPVTITIDDKRIFDYKQSGLATPLTMPDPQTPYPKVVTKSAPVQVVYKPLHIEGAQFNDSIVTNIVSVTGAVDGNSETHTASANVMIGNVNDPPYGIPVSGTITSLDDHFYWLKDESGQLVYKQHCGEVLRDSAPTRCVLGGLDIAGNGGQAVLSTTTGKVVYANFDCRLGGVVYVDSTNVDTGHNYRAAFLHLSGQNLPQRNSVIRRGQQVGVVYDKNIDSEGCPGGLTFETGAHLHYQVLRDGTNAKFGDLTNAGVCRVSGKRTDFTESTDSYSQAVKDYPNPITQTTDCTSQ